MRCAFASALTTAAVLVTAAVVSPCAAQPPALEPGSPYVLTDSTRILPRWLEGQIQAGLGWMGSPTHERQRYQVGIGAAAGVEIRPATWFALRARIAYLDLPPDQLQLYLRGSAFTQFRNSIGRGNLVTGVIEAAAPLPWRFTAFGGAGGARYRSNGVAGVLLPDGTGFRALEGSGWGAAWSTGLRYGFQPNARDHVFLEGRTESVAMGAGFRFWALSIGYRFP